MADADGDAVVAGSLDHQLGFGWGGTETDRK